MKLILLGAPGAGKGTQAELISKKLSIPSVSTGNILREAIKNGTETGYKAKSYTDKGKLVPDDVVINIIRERLSMKDCKNGFILDGFPRTIPQAQTLDSMGIEIDRVVSIEVRDDVIVRRMSSRRVCDSCGASFHLEFKKPANEGVCDVCGSKLICRKDDAPETVQERLSTYHDITEPLKGYYEQSGRLIKVNGEHSMEEVFKSIIDALEIRI